jgi:DNA-binding MarR family transcriptional regulator
MDHPIEEGFLPGQNIVFALSKARNLLTADMDVALAGTGVTSSQVGLLLFLSLGLAHSSTALSRLLCIDSGFVTRLIDRLERKGFVQRVRDGQDRRVVNLALTEPGRHAAARIVEIVPAVLNRRLSSFTPLELQMLHSLLGKFLDD